MKCIRLLLIALTLALFCSQALAEGRLRIATEGAYPPFNSVNDRGEVVGFDVDIALALCEAMGKECAIVTNEWDTILDGLEFDRYDMVIASMAQTTEREKKADFTEPYYRSRSTFVADPEKEFIQTREGVKGMVLGAQQGTVQAQYLTDNFEGAATIRLGISTKDAFAMLARGDTDAMLSDSLTIYEFLQTDEGKRFDFVGRPLPATDPSSLACIAVRKGNSELVEAINKALRTIRLNGAYDKINHKYFPFSIY